MSRETFQRAIANSAVAHLKMMRKAGRYVLWVEGPDDCVVFERFAASNCKVKDLYGKDYVIRAVREALALRPPEGGFLGIVDQDFDGIEIPELRPARLAVISCRYADLEASMLSTHAKEVIADLVRADGWDAIPWLAGRDHVDPLRRLVTEILAPIGAIRSRWTSHSRLPSIELAGNPIDQVMSQIGAGQGVVWESIRVMLCGRVPRDSVHLVDQLMSDAARLVKSLDAWRLVRGKDLVRALAWLLSKNPSACFYQSDSIERLERRIQDKVVTLFDEEVLRAAGTLDQLGLALDAVGESPRLYLQVV